MSDAHSQPSDPTRVCGSSRDGPRRQEVTARDREGHAIESVQVHKIPRKEGSALRLSGFGCLIRISFLVTDNRMCQHGLSFPLLRIQCCLF